MSVNELTPLQEARQALHDAARQYSEAPNPDPSGPFADLALRRAAIEFTRELLVAMLGLHNMGLETEIDELMHLADLSLKVRGGIRDTQLGKLFREYRARWDLQ